jgi:hypothetical protein
MRRLAQILRKPLAEIAETGKAGEINGLQTGKAMAETSGN